MPPKHQRNAAAFGAEYEWPDGQAPVARPRYRTVEEVPQLVARPAAAQIMRDMHVRSAFIMHHAGGIIFSAAVLTYKNLLRHMAAKDDSELKDLGTQADAAEVKR